MLRFDEDGPSADEYWITISENVMRIYDDNFSYIDQPDKPIIQIPTKAIETVKTDLKLDILELDPQIENFNTENNFGIKLKIDFLYAYIRDSYDQYGLPEDEMQKARNNELYLDENTSGLVDFFTCIERHIFSKPVDEDKEICLTLDEESH